MEFLKFSTTQSSYDLKE